MCEYRQSSAQPVVGPGQIWLIEQTSATALFPLDRGALAHADVVIYDRSLAALVAGAVPIGSYAEPLSLNAGAAHSAIASRALEFAAGGWSVVQLVVANPGRRARLHDAAEALSPLVGGADLPVLVIAKSALDGCRSRDASLRDLPECIDEFGGSDPLTLVFGPLSVRYPAQADAFTANGLAG